MKHRGWLLFCLGLVLCMIGGPAHLRAYNMGRITSAEQTLQPLSGITQVDAGRYHTCVLTDSGGVKCWGGNGAGQLGDGTTKNKPIPVDVNGLDSGVTAIAVGTWHTCALTNGGGVKCWGKNEYSQLGDGTATNQSIPVDVMSLDSGVVAIAAGGGHTCALTRDGGVRCWGLNFNGQLGDGTAGNQKWLPVNVIGLSSGVVAITAGDAHTCALTTNGGVKCWGYNNAGQLGDGTTVDKVTPMIVVGLGSGIAAITTGVGHTCALTDSGGVKCWGFNNYGQLGDGTTGDNKSLPVNVVGLASGVAAITAGYGHTCALTSGGGVKCWGRNNTGQLGDGTTGNDRPNPVDVTGLGNGVVAIAAGNSHTCALTSGGGVKCWGRNNTGQLGNGTTGSDSPNPVDVTGLGNRVIAITAGFAHTCALTSDGGVKCWGDNQDGQLGDGTTTWRNTPVNVIDLSTGVTAISAGYGHTCALTGGGGTKCWGRNLNGQLGDGTQEKKSIPVDVLGLSSGVASIATGNAHSCVLTRTSGIKCWGWNNSGQLGDGTTGDNKLTPVDVVGLDNAMTAIVLGGVHTCALNSGGAVKCWGRNNYGQLGDGTMGNNKPIPVDVMGLDSNVLSIALGQEHTCALNSNGGVKCWGWNAYAQLGDGAAWRTTPVDVMTQLGSTPTTTPTQTLTNTPTTTFTATSTRTATPTHTPIFTPTATPVPPYEPNDTCAQARPISTDGAVQNHTFHTPGDQDWAYFDGVQGTEYLIEARVPDDSPADVVLQVFDGCGGASTPHDSFSPDVRVQFKSPNDGPIYLQLSNSDRDVAGPAVRYQLSVRALSATAQPGGLVLVAGRLKANDPLQADIHAVTNGVYRLFLAQGYPPERIYYLAPDLSLDPDRNPATQDVDALTSRERLAYALTQWPSDAQLGLGPDRPLTVYLMDHGEYDVLFLDGRNDKVAPDDLNGWLNTLETAWPGVRVNVVVEACYSGSFIDPAKSVSKAGRVVISSASNAGLAYVSPEGGAVFSNAFIQSLGQGMSLYAAFAQARDTAVRWHPDQRAWLDDTGDGRYDSAGDGGVAQRRGFQFAGSLSSAPEPPYIAWARGPEQIQDRRGILSAWVRDDASAPQLNVWAVVYEPDYVPPATSDELVAEDDLPTIRLLDGDGDGVYTGLYTGFDQVGVYRIVVYATDEDGQLSRPREVLVRTGWKLFLPGVAR